MPPDSGDGEAYVGIGRLLLLASGPLVLIVAVLGSILKGIATPTEAAATPTRTSGRETDSNPDRRRTRQPAANRHAILK